MFISVPQCTLSVAPQLWHAELEKSVCRTPFRAEVAGLARLTSDGEVSESARSTGDQAHAKLPIAHDPPGIRWPEPLYSANGPFRTESLPYP
jgi:hypothetical protein